MLLQTFYNSRQSPSLQFPVSVGVAPSHVTLSLVSASMQGFTRVRIPSPHVTLQAPHSPHSPHVGAKNDK